MKDRLVKSFSALFFLLSQFTKRQVTVMSDYTLIRSDRKTLALEIDRTGALIVRAPRRMSTAAIDRFVESRRQWIKQKQQLALSRAAAVTPAAGADAAVWYCGRQYPIMRQTVSKPAWQPDGLAIPQAWTAAKLRDFLKGECRRLIAARLPVLSEWTGLVPTGFHITEAQTRWGSCSGKNSLNFAWRLVFCPPEIMDYVILHELCHIRHKNHSRQFWALVAQFDPAYVQHRAWLRDHAALMTLF